MLVLSAFEKDKIKDCMYADISEEDSKVQCEPRKHSETMGDKTEKKVRHACASKQEGCSEQV